MSGSYDDHSAEEIDPAVKHALAQLRLAEFVETVVQCEISLILAMAEDD